jgi:hypothetical protein
MQLRNSMHRWQRHQRVPEMPNSEDKDVSWHSRSTGFKTRLTLSRQREKTQRGVCCVAEPLRPSTQAPHFRFGEAGGNRISNAIGSNADKRR